MTDQVKAPLISFQEMERKYSGEWVLIVDYDIDPETHDIARGRVIAHSIDASEVDAVDFQLKPKKAAYHCFRPPGEGTTLIL